MSKSNLTILLAVVVATLSISFVATYQMMISEIIYLDDENKRLNEVVFIKNVENEQLRGVIFIQNAKEAKRIEKERKHLDDLKPFDITLFCENYNSI